MWEIQKSSLSPISYRLMSCYETAQLDLNQGGDRDITYLQITHIWISNLFLYDYGKTY